MLLNQREDFHFPQVYGEILLYSFYFLYYACMQLYFPVYAYIIYKHLSGQLAVINFLPGPIATQCKI